MESGDSAAARSDVLYRKLVDGGLVYDSSSGRIHHLNETAAFIWEACQEGSAAPAIARRLCERYEVDETIADREVAQTLERFSRCELLR